MFRMTHQGTMQELKEYFFLALNKNAKKINIHFEYREY